MNDTDFVLVALEMPLRLLLDVYSREHDNAFEEIQSNKCWRLVDVEVTSLALFIFTLASCKRSIVCVLLL